MKRQNLRWVWPLRSVGKSLTKEDLVAMGYGELLLCNGLTGGRWLARLLGIVRREGVTVRTSEPGHLVFLFSLAYCYAYEKPPAGT